MPEPKLRSVDSLPAPLTPEGSSLQHFRKMQFDLIALRHSRPFLSGTPEEIGAFTNLAFIAWHEIPAGSLPNDDTALSRLAGYGNDIVSWNRIRPAVMACWELCSDGRLYHPLIAQEVERALKLSRRQSTNGKKTWSNKRKLKAKDDDAMAMPRSSHGEANDRDRTQTEESKKESKSCERSAESVSDPEPPLRPWRQRATQATAPPPPEPRSEPPQPEPPPEDRSPRKPDHARFAINTGIAFLAEHGKTEQQARPLIGKWRKELNYNDTELFRIFSEARDRADPVAWICASIRHAKGPATGSKAPPWTYQEGYCRDVH